VILYEKNPTLEIIANNKQSLIIYPEKRNITTNLVGLHQLSNARIAYEAGLFLSIPEAVIKQALLHVDHPGRLQYLRANILIDGAHNEDGMRKLRQYLE
jgi:dihydrofolate synthase/folylpolyglutamate synthase